MKRTIMHIDFNSYFATVEQQANPRLRGKPIGVTGGDRTQRTVLGAASVEAKKLGMKTGMTLWEAKRLCPEIILVPGDSNKYLETTKRFLNILKHYSPFLEVFSIDEAFLELPTLSSSNSPLLSSSNSIGGSINILDSLPEFTPDLIRRGNDSGEDTEMIKAVEIAQEIKSRIKQEVGEWITCSIGISYNKLIAKLAGSLYKPDGLVVIADPEAAVFILDRIGLDEVCGIGGRTKKRLNNMGIFDFRSLRQVPLENLLASFKSYGRTLYGMARGEDDSLITPFYEKEEVKSAGHRHTIDHDTDELEEIKGILLKLTELIARRLRAKNLTGKTVHCYFRYMLDPNLNYGFIGDGRQRTISYTNDGLEIFKGAWRIFREIWSGEKIRMIGATVSNLKAVNPKNLTFLEEDLRQETIIRAIDKINNSYGEFKIQRASVMQSPNVYHKPNPFLADRRFKL